MNHDQCMNSSARESVSKTTFQYLNSTHTQLYHEMLRFSLPALILNFALLFTLSYVLYHDRLLPNLLLHFKN